MEKYKNKEAYLRSLRKTSDKAKKERHYQELQKKFRQRDIDERSQRRREMVQGISVPIMKAGSFLGKRLKSEWKHRKKMRKQKVFSHSTLKPMRPLGSM